MTDELPGGHTGRVVVDSSGDRLGVCLVELADSSGRVVWVGVELEAPPSTRTMIPVVDAELADDILCVAYDRATVVGAPLVGAPAIHEYYQQYTARPLDGPPRDWP